MLGFALLNANPQSSVSYSTPVAIALSSGNSRGVAIAIPQHLMQYRRARASGATYFFTVVTYQRQAIFDNPETVAILRKAFRTVKARMPFIIDAAVILPDHLHCIWTLPEGDSNFSTRWRRIKTEFSRDCPKQYKQLQSKSRLKKGEQAIWQRRFWEHQIRNEQDFEKHVDYVHFNPVKHGLVAAPVDWPYTSFRRYVRDGVYVKDWTINVSADINAGCK